MQSARAQKVLHPSMNHQVKYWLKRKKNQWDIRGQNVLLSILKWSKAISKIISKTQADRLQLLTLCMKVAQHEEYPVQN